MNHSDGTPLVARCIVCRGNIHEGDRFEIWESAYYCERHSIPWLNERARQYADLLRESPTLKKPHSS
ncbi:MAG TPA: hypothetical protein VF898_03730 [Chloroflexota bacterium]